MSDRDPDTAADPGDARPGDPAVAHPAQEAHGGSMAPGLTDDIGRPAASQPPGEPDTAEPDTIEPPD